MDTLQSILTAKATRAIDEAFGEALSEHQSIADIAVCQQETFGHYQCNVESMSCCQLGQVSSLAAVLTKDVLG